MRVVEPKQFSHSNKKNRTTQKRRGKKFAVLFILITLVSAGTYMLKENKFTNEKVVSKQEQTPSPAPTTPEPQPVIEPPIDTVKDTLRQFSANEFKLFYDNLRQTNLEPVENPPVISGNDIADARIREIAEQRGYRLRSSPSSGLFEIDGQQLQSSAADAWVKLKAKASKAGHSMSLVSGYRSVGDQRALYLSRLAATGVTIEEVANGDADAEVNQVLVTSSIPGYSKHHTGYTMDLQCAGYVFENFKNSPCHDWLSVDNFKIAKELGFIPSYPDGADAQGPDPEAWEYVYVGTDLLYE